MFIRVDKLERIFDTYQYCDDKGPIDKNFGIAISLDKLIEKSKSEGKTELSITDSNYVELIAACFNSTQKAILEEKGGKFDISCSAKHILIYTLLQLGFQDNTRQNLYVLRSFSLLNLDVYNSLATAGANCRDYFFELLNCFKLSDQFYVPLLLEKILIAKEVYHCSKSSDEGSEFHGTAISLNCLIKTLQLSNQQIIQIAKIRQDEKYHNILICAEHEALLDWAAENPEEEISEEAAMQVRELPADAPAKCIEALFVLKESRLDLKIANNDLGDALGTLDRTRNHKFSAKSLEPVAHVLITWAYNNYHSSESQRGREKRSSIEIPAAFIALCFDQSTCLLRPSQDVEISHFIITLLSGGLADFKKFMCALHAKGELTQSLYKKIVTMSRGEQKSFLAFCSRIDKKCSDYSKVIRPILDFLINENGKLEDLETIFDTVFSSGKIFNFSKDAQRFNCLVSIFENLRSNKVSWLIDRLGKHSNPTVEWLNEVSHCLVEYVPAAASENMMNITENVSDRRVVKDAEDLMPSSFKELLKTIRPLRAKVAGGSFVNQFFEEKNQNSPTMRSLVNAIVGCLDAIATDYKTLPSANSDLHKEGIVYLLKRLVPIRDEIFMRACIYADVTNLNEGTIISDAPSGRQPSYTVSLPMLFKEMAKHIEACGLIDDEDISNHLKMLAMGRLKNDADYNWDDAYTMKLAIGCLNEMIEQHNGAMTIYFKLLSCKFKLFLPNALLGQYPSKNLTSVLNPDRKCSAGIYGTRVAGYLLSPNRTLNEVYEAIDVLSYYGYKGWLSELDSSPDVVDLISQNIPACAVLLRNAKQRFDFVWCLAETASKTHILFTMKVIAKLMTSYLSAIDSVQLADLKKSVKHLLSAMTTNYQNQIEFWCNEKGIERSDLVAQLNLLDQKIQNQIGLNDTASNMQSVTGYGSLNYQHATSSPVPVCELELN